MGDSKDLVLEDVGQMQDRRTGFAASILVAILGVLLGVGTISFAGTTHAEPHAALGLLVNVAFAGVVGGSIAAWWYGWVGKKAARVRAALRLTKDAIALDGRHLLARSEVKSAIVWPSRSKGTIVRIDRRGPLRPPIDLQVAGLDDARALVRALGHTSAQSARGFRIQASSLDHYRQRLRAFWIGMPVLFAALPLGAAWLGAHTATFTALSVALGIVFAALSYQMMSNARVVVGADGVEVRWLTQKRFIPMANIVRVETVLGDGSVAGYVPTTLRIHLRDGPPVELLTELTRATAASDERWAHLRSQRADVVAERIDEAVAAHGEGASTAELATWQSELLSRGERAVEAWVETLRGVARNADSFRQPAGGGVDALWGVVEDAAAEPERRAAAAVALAPHLDDGGRERVRIAARATVAPKLRIALEAAANDDEAALAEALEEVAPARRATTP